MSCDICEIKDVVYEDKVCFIYLSKQPTVLGHLIVAPREHYEDIQDIPNEIVTHLFFAASYAATALFEGLGAHGTNIIVNNGKESDRASSHFMIHVIPRKTGDGLDFKWKPKKIAEAEMKSILEQIKDKTFFIGKKKKKELPDFDEEQKQELPEEQKKEESYLIKKIQRIP